MRRKFSSLPGGQSSESGFLRTGTTNLQELNDAEAREGRTGAGTTSAVEFRISFVHIDMGKQVTLLLALFLAHGASATPPPHSVSRRPSPPRHIRIGAVVYTVELVQKVPPTGDASSLAGQTCDENAVKAGWCTARDHIYLEAGRTLQQERTTLLHEIQHVLLGTEHSEEETTYHAFIYTLSPKLLQVLQDNPDLLIYLTAPGPK